MSVPQTIELELTITKRIVYVFPDFEKSATAARRLMRITELKKKTAGKLEFSNTEFLFDEICCSKAKFNGCISCVFVGKILFSTDESAESLNVFRV